MWSELAWQNDNRTSHLSVDGMLVVGEDVVGASANVVGESEVGAAVLQTVMSMQRDTRSPTPALASLSSRWSRAIHLRGMHKRGGYRAAGRREMQREG